jgi:hypothetical protein
MAQLPTIHNALFYVADDSAAQFIPTWYHLGELLRSGRFPLLEPSMWAGGNIAAEALFGIWNPVLLGNMALVSTIPDPLVAADLVKTEFLTILALGVYGVAREYHVGRWISIVPASHAVRRGHPLLRRQFVGVRPDRVRIRPALLVDAAACRPRRCSSPPSPLSRAVSR